MTAQIIELRGVLCGAQRWVVSACRVADGKRFFYSEPSGTWVWRPEATRYSRAAAIQTLRMFAAADRGADVDGLVWTDGPNPTGTFVYGIEAVL